MYTRVDMTSITRIGSSLHCDIYTNSPKDSANNLSGRMLSFDSAFKPLGHCAMPQLWDAL